MKPITHAWKVVRKDGDKLVSASCRDWEVEYKLNEWAEPAMHYKNQFLMAFRTRKHARAFKKQYDPANFNGLVIYRCEVDNAAARRDGVIYFDKDEFEPINFCNWPDGTLFADAIKLLKRNK